MSWLSSFLNPGRGYEKSQDTLDQYYNQAQGYSQPYNQFGKEQYTNLNSLIENLMNPDLLQNKWISGYKESDAAKNAEDLAQEHGLNAANAMGLGGSNTALDAILKGKSQISMNDRQNYLNDLMQKYLAGAGISQGIFNQGASSAGQMGQNAMNMGQNSAQMSYGKENVGGNMLSTLIGQGAGL